MRVLKNDDFSTVAFGIMGAPPPKPGQATKLEVGATGMGGDVGYNGGAAYDSFYGSGQDTIGDEAALQLVESMEVSATSPLVALGLAVWGALSRAEGGSYSNPMGDPSP